MIQKIAILVVREGKESLVRKYFQFTRLEKMLNVLFFFFSNMSAYFLLGDVSIYLTHSCVHVS